MAKQKNFSNKKALIFFIIAVLLTILSLILAINVCKLFKEDLIESAMDILSWLIPLAICLVFWILFLSEISKVTASDEELEEWKNQILAKHPGSNNYLKQEDMKKFSSKLSFWLHSLHISFVKITTAVILPVALVGFVASIVVPFTGIFSGGSSSFSYGTYISDCSSCVVVTAYNFKSDKTFERGTCDKEAGYTFKWNSSGTYTLSGSTIKISAGTFTVINSTKLKDSSGGYWIKR